MASVHEREAGRKASADTAVEALHVCQIRLLMERIGSTDEVLLDDAIDFARDEVRRLSEWEMDQAYSFPGQWKAERALPAMIGCDQETVDAVFSPRRSRVVIDALRQFCKSHQISTGVR